MLFEGDQHSHSVRAWLKTITVLDCLKYRKR